MELQESDMTPQVLAEVADSAGVRKEEGTLNTKEDTLFSARVPLSPPTDNI